MTNGSELLTWPQRGRLWLRLGIRALLIVLAVLALVWVVLPLASLLMPFVLALIFAWILNPLVRWLRKKTGGNRKVISLILLIVVFGLVGALCYALGWALFGQIQSLMENWQGVVNGIYATVDTVGEWVRHLGDVLPDSVVSTGDDLVTSVGDWVRSLDFSGILGAIAGRATAWVSGVPSFAVASVVFIMASYFITSDYPRLRCMVTEQIPTRVRGFCGQVRRIFMEAFGGYIKSQLLLSLGVFVILTVGFLIIRQPYGLLLAFALAVMDFIPIIGAGTVMVPWAVVDVITGQNAQAAELMAIWGVIVLFRRVGEPKILGDQTGLSPILSLLGIYAGMQLGGVAGMILGPLLLLVLINLAKLGIFRPVAGDLRAAAVDIGALLKGEAGSDDSGGSAGSDGPDGQEKG